MDQQTEGKLVDDAKEAILKRIAWVAAKMTDREHTGSGGILDLAEAYTVLNKNQLSGRINVPPKD